MANNTAEQDLIFRIGAQDDASVLLKKVQKALEGLSGTAKNTTKEFEDFSKEAFAAAQNLSKVLGKSNAAQAQKMANVLRSFHHTKETDEQAGIVGLWDARTVKEASEAFAQLTSTQASSIMGMLDNPEKELTNFVGLANKATYRLNSMFTREQAVEAQKIANTLRQFDDTLSKDTGKGLYGILEADNIQKLGQAFASLTTGQVSSLVGAIDEPVVELKDLSKDAMEVAERLSRIASPEGIKNAQKIAKTIRAFDPDRKHDVAQGLWKLNYAQTAKDIGKAFAQMSESEVNALLGMYEAPVKQQSLLEKGFERFKNRAEKSMKSFRRFLDRIGNIIVYRLIRQGLSLMVSQVQEGTKAVYMWSRAFHELDTNNIAQNLDMIATKLDNIRGNLGAAWGTILANFSGAIEGGLNKVSEGIEKVTAFASAMNGSATYARVAETNVKRYYEAVTNGLQGITVIGRVTQMEDAPIPDDIKSFAQNIREEMGDLGTLAGGLSAGIGLMLIATGHVVAGLALGGAALGIYNTTSQLDDASSTSDKVKQIFKNIGGILPSIELGLGLALISSGQMSVGIPLILKGASSQLNELSKVDLNSELTKALTISKVALDSMSLGLGAILCAHGQYTYGIPLLVSGLTGTVETVATNWDDIMDAFKYLGERIEIWWWSLWNGMIGATWEEKVKAFREAFPETVSDTSSYAEWRAAVKRAYAEQQEVAPGMTLQEYKDKIVSGELGIFESTKIFNDWQESIRDAEIKERNELTRNRKLNEILGISQHANGGFPSAGSLFLAGEVPGQTELLGTINGRTGVAGGAEITGIREAIYEVGAEIITQMRSNNVNVTLEGDADGIFNIVRQKASDYTRATGNLAF